MRVASIAPYNTNTFSSKKKQQIISAKSTGYVAAVGMGLSMLSGIVKNKFLNKNHKIFATISLVAVAAHMYILLSKRKRNR